MFSLRSMLLPSRDVYAQTSIAQERIRDKILLRGRSFIVAPLDTVELCVPGVPFNWLRTSRHAPENAIFVEFGQCLAWAFIDLPLLARNAAPICAPGKKREKHSLSFSLPPSWKPRGKGHPREIRRRVVWFMAEVPRRRSPPLNFVKLPPLCSPFSRSLLHRTFLGVPFPPRAPAKAVSTLSPSPLFRFFHP